MSRVLIFHACGHPAWHELPAMGRAERTAVAARMAVMRCPACWCGSEAEYEAAWGGDGRVDGPTGDGKGGRR